MPCAARDMTTTLTLVLVWLNVVGLSAAAGPTHAPVRPAERLETSPELVELGRSTYVRLCAMCHGEKGDGAGEVAPLLSPKPRDFTDGRYRLVSTWSGDSTGEDLFATLSRGMPGSPMPPWAHLPRRTRWALVRYLETLDERTAAPAPDREPELPGEKGSGLLRPPPRPPFDEPARARARELWAAGCSPCHGPTGRGDGELEQRDAAGDPLRPPDFAAGIFRGRPEPEEIYKRIVLGLPGSPMPSNAYLHGPDAWGLTELVLGLSTPEQRASQEIERRRIVAGRVEALPDGPGAAGWRRAPPWPLARIALRSESGPLPTIVLRALHDGSELALLLEWADTSPSTSAASPGDAAAVGFSEAHDPPLFATAAAGSPASLWIWSGAGSDGRGPASGERSDGARFASLGGVRARDRQVRSAALHDGKAYRVVLRRPLATESSAELALAPGKRYSVALAVRDLGADGTRDRESTTIWHGLELEP